MHWRVASLRAIEFKNRLGFNYPDLILNKEQAVILKILKSFSGIKMIEQYSVLSKYKIDLYLPDYRLPIEIDGNGQKNQGTRKKKETTLQITKELHCKFIRNNPDSKGFDMDPKISTIFNHINEVNKKLFQKETKESLIEKISNILLGLEFESNNSIKTKCLKCIVKHILPTLQK